MNNINQTNLMNQMQALESLSQGKLNLAEQSASDSTSFSSMMSSAINQINQSQAQASELRQSFEMGNSDVGLSEVMIAVQKSRISFEALSQVRNKLLTAYKDVMNMPV